MGAIFKDGVKFKKGQIAKMGVKTLAGVEVADVTEVMTIAKTKEFFMQGVNDFLQDPDAPRDTAWEELFRTIESDSYGELFPLRTPTLAGAGSHGIVFKEVGENGEIKFSRTSATSRFVPAVKYGTALSYSNEWFEDGQMNLIEMVTEDFRESSLDKMAAIHYAALAAAITAGATTVAMTGVTAAEFINKVNDALVAMQRNKRKASHCLMAPEQEQWVAIAMGAKTGLGTEGLLSPIGGSISASRLKPLVSEHLAAGSMYIAEAKKRLFSVARQGLRLDSFDDLLHGASTIVGTFRRGILVAENAVLRQITNIPQNLAVA